MLRRLGRFRCICFCMSLSCLMAWEPARADAPNSDVAAGVRQAVIGILSYTRWPQPTPALRLCVVGHPDYAAALFGGAMQIGKAPVTVSQNAAGASDIGTRCDAVYSGQMPQAEQQHLRQLLSGHPVLTITEDDPPCSGSNMFCLDLAAGSATAGFSVNLDSVARSGVAVNPRVLLLGRRRKAGR